MERAHAKDLVLTDYAKKLIKFKARQLSRRQGFRSSDVDDLEQELWLTLIKNADQFDPTKASLDTFIDCVVKSAAAMIRRGRRRRNQALGMQQSLDSNGPVTTQEGKPIAASISQADLTRLPGSEFRDKIDLVDEAEAITRALAEMPPDLREICRRLMSGTIFSVARSLGITRRQVRNAISSARLFFEQAGLELFS